MTRFVVDLGDIALTKEAQTAINKDIQKAVMVHLAAVQPEKAYSFRFPRDWYGFILRQEMAAIAEAEKAIGVNLPQIAGRM